MQTILFYNDSKFIGGHEILSVEAVKTLSSHYKIKYIVNTNNIQLISRLSDIHNVNIIKIDYASNKFQAIRNWLSFKSVNKLICLINNIKPDLCILIQGNIETSMICSIACKRVHIPCYSYIPLTQPFSRTSKNRIVGKIKDFIHNFTYSIPDGYITISEYLRHNINYKNISKPVYIVHNKIDSSILKHEDKEIARKFLSLNPYKYILGYIGRLEAWHKGLDNYISFLESKIYHYPEILFLFVGDGPLSSTIQKLSSKHRNLKLINWTDDLSLIYSALDAIIIPSRYEGVSLTMMEALWYKLPIIASKISEFLEFIPQENLFEVNRFESIDSQLQRLKSRELKIAETPDFVSQDMFSTEFLNTVNHILKNHPDNR